MKQIATLVLLVMASGVCAETEIDRSREVYRDWQVENALVAGVANTMSFGFFPGSSFGSGRQVAEASDPYAVSDLVHQQLVKMSRLKYQTGSVIGAAFWVSLFIAALARVLNKLEPTTTADSREVEVA